MLKISKSIHVDVRCILVASFFWKQEIAVIILMEGAF